MLEEKNANEIVETEEESFEILKEKVLNDELKDAETDKNFIPAPYVVTNHGIKKICKKSIDTICPRPILIKDKIYNLEDKTFKLTLEHLNARQQWHDIPAQGNEIIFHKNRVIDLCKFGLPVTSGNASKIVDWIYNLYLANENKLPITYTVNRCGWFTYRDKDYFIDPRITNTVKEGGRDINIVADNDNQMAQDLKTAGTLEEWKKAYKLARPSTIARATVAAALSAPLLKLLGERNFVFYVHGKTRGGKSTSLFLAASAVGNSNLVRVFDATSNGLTAAAMNTNHYPFFIDERQSADKVLKSNFQRWIYNDANGTERTRANKDGTVKAARTWQHITICNGETLLLDDTATGGAHTRILQIAAPEVIIDPADCKTIRDITAKNYGVIYPLFVSKIKEIGVEKLREQYQANQKYFNDYCSCNEMKILPDYIRYISLILLADSILNDLLELSTRANGTANSGLNWGEILDALPTAEETDDAAREENFVNAFIAAKVAHFEGSYNFNKDRGLDVYGKYKDGYLYIISIFLNKHLAENGLDPKKVVSDLIAKGKIIPADKVEKGNKSALATVVIKINGKSQRCYKFIDEDYNDTTDEE